MKMKSKYYDYYKAKAPLTIKELNARTVPVVRYYEGFNYEEWTYEYRWQRTEITMSALVKKADEINKPDYKDPSREYVGLDNIVNTIRGVAEKYRAEEAEAIKQRRPVRITPELRTAWADAMSSIEQANQRRIDYHPQFVALKKADWYAAEEQKKYEDDCNTRWKSLKAYDVDEIISKPSELYKMDAMDRAIWLDRAADLGLIPREQVRYTKDICIFQPAAIADYAEPAGSEYYWLRPFNTRHEIGKNGYQGESIISVVGKHKQTVLTNVEENEIIAMAMYMEAYYGDEFLMKTTTPEGVVTRRDIRLGLVEDEPIDWYDFLTPLHEDKESESDIEDDSNLFEDILDDKSEYEEPEEVTYFSETVECDEDELDYMNGTEL